MPRLPTVPGKPYTANVTVKLNDAGIVMLDRLRGRRSRSAYLRELLRDEAQRKLKEQ